MSVRTRRGSWNDQADPQSPGNQEVEPFRVLLAEGGEKEAREFRDAWMNTGTDHPLDTVSDADSCLSYLHERENEDEGNGKKLPGYIVLDVGLSRMRGLDVLREIKSNPHLRRTPVIVLTRLYSPELVDRAYELGASAFIRTPDDPAKFQDCVTRVVRFWDASEPPISVPRLL
jgi:CheY-like chemotaxis protein